MLWPVNKMEINSEAGFVYFYLFFILFAFCCLPFACFCAGCLIPSKSVPQQRAGVEEDRTVLRRRLSHNPGTVMSAAAPV